jgi:hypothetical protein
MSEGEIQKLILDWLKLRNIFHWRNNTGRRGKVSYGCKGSPDIICLHQGRFVGIEVKGEKGELSKEQCDFRCRIEKAGGIYIMARDLVDIVDFF